VTHQGAARDAASVHFRPSITRRTCLFSLHCSNYAGFWHNTSANTV